MLEIEDVRFSYGKETVLKGFHILVEEGEIFSLLGGSGSGKTTILNLIAGFERPSKGSIRIDGKDVKDTAPEKRKVGMVFQDNALFPHLNVGKNILYGAGKRRSRDLLDELVELVGLEGKTGRMPSDLSGGEKQRVALARTLAYDPKIILLDEPLSSLDASLRVSLRNELRSILKERGITTIHVTHDQTEAMAVADRMGLLYGGVVSEIGRPEDLYERPKKVVTARFMGFNNIFPAKYRDGFLVTPIGNIPWEGKVPDMIGFRSEKLGSFGNGIPIKGRIISREYRGRDLHIVLDANGNRLEALVPPKSVIGKNAELYLSKDDIIPLGK
jgi:iron(III) transport system ATP-binding protein